MATASGAAAQWAQRLAQSGPKITDGVQSTKVAPGAAAARQADVWLQNTTNAKTKWQQNVASVSLSDWQNAMTTKGIPRIAAGATAAQPKFEAFMAKALPYIENLKGTLPARGDLEANIARSAAFARGMSKFNPKA